MADAIVKGAYIAMWLVGAGVVSSGILWLSLKCKYTKEIVKEFFNLN